MAISMLSRTITTAPVINTEHDVTDRFGESGLESLSDLYSTSIAQPEQSPEHCPEGQLQPARENTRLLEITRD